MGVKRNQNVTLVKHVTANIVAVLSSIRSEPAYCTILKGATIGVGNHMLARRQVKPLGQHDEVGVPGSIRSICRNIKARKTHLATRKGLGIDADRHVVIKRQRNVHFNHGVLHRMHMPIPIVHLHLGKLRRERLRLDVEHQYATPTLPSQYHRPKLRPIPLDDTAGGKRRGMIERMAN